MANVYLDPINGDDANDGLSWANTMRTLDGAMIKYYNSNIAQAVVQSVYQYYVY